MDEISKKSQSSATLYIYIVGMAIFSICILTSHIFEDYKVLWGILGIIIYTTVAFIFCYSKQRYLTFVNILIPVASVLFFPTTMLLTNYPHHVIIYQLITPSVWALAATRKEKVKLWPILVGLLLALVNYYKFSQIFGIKQGIEMAAIFLITFNFLYYISSLYIRNMNKACNQLKEQIKIDYLTTAYNKLGIQDQIKKHIQNKIPFYLIYVDIDNFKIVNDTAGHDAGDELLKEVTVLWWQNLYDVKHCLGRIGGDEFIILIESDSDEYIKSVLPRILSIAKLSNNKLLENITLSAGVSAYPKDTTSAENLLIYADTAMYKAKQSGKNDYRFFDKILYNKLMLEYETKDCIRNAMSEDLFEIYYQPQVSLTTNVIYGYEALLRLQKDGNYMKPQYVVDIAENTGLIYDLDNYILNKVTCECKSLLKKNPDLVISVNISGKHLALPNAVDQFVEILDKNKFATKNICLEITESSLISSFQIAKDNIKKLNDLGIKLALDDFGMGYSSLSYLNELQVDHIKIEKFFVNNLLERNSKSKVPNLIIKIGKLFNYKIIAEGVESTKQKEYLSKKKCDIAQGFLYAKPLKLTDAINYLSSEIQ